MTFQSPGALLLLAALAPALVLMAADCKRRIVPLCSLRPSRVPRLSAGERKPRLLARYIASSLFTLVFLACLCIAAAGPLGGIRLVREPRGGVDIVLAFDLSRSMDALDAGPDAFSRLERSRSIAREMLERLRGADGGFGRYRFGAALGKGAAVLAVPLTGDAEALFGLLDSLDSRSITSRGTNLERLVDAAAGAFQAAFPTSRFIVLFSDGEALSGAIEAAASRARQSQITLVAVGAGSLTGVSLLEEADGAGASARPVEPPVTSRLRRDVLADAAGLTGGAFIDGNADTAAALLVGRVKAGAASGIADGGDADWGIREERAPLWRLFVLAALAAFILSRLCTVQARAKQRVIDDDDWAT
jgi:Ca-activated chloride channel family protein